MKEPLEANISYMGDEAKIKFYIGGKEYAFRLKQSELPKLEHAPLEIIKRVTFL